MKERLIEFLKSENKSAAQFAEEIGVQPSGISHILSGRNKPSLDLILKMLDKYTFLSMEWLLFGKGNMYKEASMQKLFDESDINTEIVEPIEKQDIKDSDKKEKVDNTENAEQKQNKRIPAVEKIVWFYSDNSFREFVPGED